MIKKFSAAQAARYSKFAADAQKDEEASVEIGFAKAAIDAGCTEAEYTHVFQHAINKLQAAAKR